MPLVAVILDGCALMNSPQGEFAQYGTWQTYSSTQVLRYPDFDLLFKDDPGEIKSLEGLPMGPEYHFTVSNGTSQIGVIWSSGTGDIGPSLFEINGKTFFLEMIRSDYLERPVSDEQIAIWPESEFFRGKNRWWFW